MRHLHRFFPLRLRPAGVRAAWGGGMGAAGLSLAVVLGSCHGQPAPPATPGLATAPSGAARAAENLSLAETVRGPVAAGVGFQTVVDLARDLSREPYRLDAATPPAELLKITYDEYRDIRFRRERALWRGAGLPFVADFFHPGFIYNRLVTVQEVAGGATCPIPYEAGLFEFGQLWEGRNPPPGVGFAGVRLFTDHYRPGHGDEVAVFQGASYYRAIGRDWAYGLSARGLALDTVGGAGEEFPTFTRFWLVRPAPGDPAVEVWALLESPRVSGAYAFRLQPGEETRTEVRAVLFLRAPVALLGLAPFSSMFWYGENSWPRPPDFRPEVHDSDGVLVAAADGRWTWRPLHNGQSLRHTRFAEGPPPRGFGLLQRDTEYRSYLDLEALYHRRPSAWVEPGAGWGEGRLHLVEIATGEESWDNVVLCWEPAAAPAPGEPLDFSYTIRWGAPVRPPDPLLRVESTRASLDFAGSRVLFLLEFAGDQPLPADGLPLPEVVAGAAAPAEVEETVLQPNPATGGYRVSLRVRLDAPLDFPSGTGAAAINCVLRRDGQPVSESWNYLWKP